MTPAPHVACPRPWLLAALLACTVLAVAPPARAVDKAAAEALFRAGKELMSQGAYVEACDRFHESHTADPSVGALLNLALCNEKQGKTATAWATYREAAAMAAAQRDERRRRGALELAHALEPELSSLTVTVATRHDGLEITRNDEPVAVGSALPVDPGTYTIVATAPGFERWSTTVDVTPHGDRQTVAIPALTRAAGAAAGPDEATSDAGAGPSWPLVSGIVLVSAGAIGLGIGIAFGVLAADGESELTQPHLCPDKVCTPGAGTDALATAETQADIATVALVAGSVAVVAGTVLLLVAPRGDEGDARLIPSVGPSHAGLALTGRF